MILLQVLNLRQEFSMKFEGWDPPMKYEIELGIDELVSPFKEKDII